MTCVVVPVAPDVFVTVSRTVTGPGWVYSQVGAAAVESSRAPSPSRSHAYVRARFPGSVEVVPSNATLSGAVPLVGTATIRAVGDWVAIGLTRRIVPPLKSG